MTAIRRAPTRAPSASSQRRPSNRRDAASAVSPAALSWNWQRAPGNGGPNASSASSSSTVTRVQPHRQRRRIMRRQQPRAISAPRRDPAGGSPRCTGPMSASRSSTATPPGRSRTGCSPVRSSTVDSTPTAHGPLSSTAAMRPDNPSSTCCAVVGLTAPDRFADGAAIGVAASRSSDKRNRMPGHPHRQRIQPGAGEQSHRTIRAARQHQRQRPRPESLRQQRGTVIRLAHDETPASAAG